MLNDFCSPSAAALWRGAQAVSPVPSVPDRVSALVGSCVVIPCSFTPPPARSPRGRKERVDVRLRFRGGGHLFPLRSTAFNSEDRDQMSWDFRGRTFLLGKITDGDCSVKLERVSVDDSHVFEITLKRGDDLLWGTPRTFRLDVLGEWLQTCADTWQERWTGHFVRTLFELPCWIRLFIASMWNRLIRLLSVPHPTTLHPSPLGGTSHSLGTIALWNLENWIMIYDK